MKIKDQSILSVSEITEKIKKALAARRPLSLGRLASGEAFTLAHDKIIPAHRIPWWVEYAGVKLPNEKARQDLLAAVREADIVGLSTDYQHWESAPLLEQALTLLKVKPKCITNSTINWHLHKNDRLYRLMGKEPTVLVGRLAAEAAPNLIKKGVNLIYTESLEGFDDLSRVEKSLLARSQFRIALVAAGIPATILCPRLAKKIGCIAIDYGHVINDLLNPGFNVNILDHEKERWRRERKNDRKG